MYSHKLRQTQNKLKTMLRNLSLLSNKATDLRLLLQPVSMRTCWLYNMRGERDNNLRIRIYEYNGDVFFIFSQDIDRDM